MEARKSKVKVSASIVSVMADFPVHIWLTVPSHGGRGQAALSGLFHKTTDLIM
jgi:hypothetical protein